MMVGGRRIDNVTCASAWPDHDYSLPPHNTPESPRIAEDDVPCQAQSSDGKLGWCEHRRAYEVIVYSPCSHDWVQLTACFPCADSIKRRHAAHGGPGRTLGVHSIRSIKPPVTG